MATVQTPSDDLPLTAASWGDLHSTIEELTVHVPDAKNWSIVKSSKPVFVAEHKKSRTALLATTFVESNLVNRAMCEERARELGLVPKAMANARTIEDEPMLGPDDFDTRVWVSMRPGEHGELVGDVMAFGARVRKCLFFHVATIVSSEKEADTLSERLAATRLHVLGDLKLDAIEDVPRAAEH